jgi:transcriptional regulator with XRE-family HTH domain
MSAFKNLLKEKRVTQCAIAEKLGVHQTLISQWCVGKGKPTIKQTTIIAKELDVSVEVVIACFVDSEEEGG